MMDLPRDITNRIGRDFGASANEASEQVAVFLCKQEEEPARSARCAIYLAQGSLQELSRMLDEAFRDWRNVILRAEHDKGKGPRVRDFDAPFEKTT
jgi:hypothetical protein